MYVLRRDRTKTGDYFPKQNKLTGFRRVRKLRKGNLIYEYLSKRGREN
jgi:hypothetical protein